MMADLRYRPFLMIACVAALLAGCKSAQRVDGSTSMRPAQAGCATCVFDMEGVVGCKLAVKIDGQAYLVVGSGIDDHGDAHASDGLCLTVRDADVEGTIEDGRFVATHFELRP